MTISTENQLQLLKNVGCIVATILKKMSDYLQIGMTTSELDLYAKTLFDYYGTESAPSKDYNFPGYTCISINQEIAHGIPSERVICAGDIVNIDVSGVKNGVYADTGGSFIVPPSNELKELLCHSTKNALKKAMQVAKAGNRITYIGREINKVATFNNFEVIENLCSHGVGNSLHEYPEDITNYYNRYDTRKLTNGMVITIEPFLSTRSRNVTEADDGWTLLGEVGNLSAQYEHTMVITKNKPIIITKL